MKNFTFLLLTLFCLALLAGNSACSPKSGCPATESLQPKTNRKGELKTSKKRQEGLFPKSMQKKMK